MRIILLVFAMGMLYSAASIMSRYYFKDEYLDYRLHIDVFDRIGENDLARDFAWAASSVSSVMLTVMLMQQLGSAAGAYALGVVAWDCIVGSRSDNKIWKTVDDNTSLESLPQTYSIILTVISYLLYLATT